MGTYTYLRPNSDDGGINGADMAVLGGHYPPDRCGPTSVQEHNVGIIRRKGALVHVAENSHGGRGWADIPLARFDHQSNGAMSAQR